MGQPGHPLVSHLGISNIWYTPIASIKSDLLTFKLSQLLRNIIPLLFKFSIIRIFNPFYPLFFKYVLTLRSLPHSMSLKTYFKYHRTKVIIDARTKKKYNYMLRVGYPKLTVSDVLILRSFHGLLVFFSFQNYMNLVRNVFDLTAAKRTPKDTYTFSFEIHNILFLLNTQI